MLRQVPGQAGKPIHKSRVSIRSSEHTRQVHSDWRGLRQSQGAHLCGLRSGSRGSGCRHRHGGGQAEDQHSSSTAQVETEESLKHPQVWVKPPGEAGQCH